MKKFGVGAILSVAAFGALLLLNPQGAYADAVTLTSTGYGPYSGTVPDGGNVYPYYFTVVNGGVTTTNVELMCISYESDIDYNESWTATVAPVSQYTGSDLTTYEEAAYIISQTSTLGAAVTQWSNWELLDPGDSTLLAGVATLSVADQKAISDLLSAASAYVVDNPDSPIYSKYVIYVPDSGSQPEGYSDPQFLIGEATPEPSSLVLLGSGLLGLSALFYWRKRSGLKRLSTGA